jgi:DNA-binding NarL/FixJ family response regulator
VRSDRPWDDARVPQTVLIVDDYAGFRRSARALLEDAGFEVVGEASDGRSALAEAQRLSPAVVLLDVQLPDEDGFTVADRLARAPSSPAVVLVSSRGASAYRPRLAVTSARGFITKADLSGERLAALLE